MDNLNPDVKDSGIKGLCSHKAGYRRAEISLKRHKLVTNLICEKNN